MSENNQKDIKRKHWTDPDEKVIWEGQPLVKWDTIKIILILGIVLIIIFTILLSLGSPPEAINALFILLGLIIFPAIYVVYDFYKIKSKNEYVLLSSFLKIKSGNQLKTKYFYLDTIKDFELRNQNIIVHLNHGTFNPFQGLLSNKTNIFKMGPFENAEGIYGTLNQHLLDYKNKNK